MSKSAYAHFIGIGGAGMSAIARVLHERGAVVSGSDLKESKYARRLSEAGVCIYIGHDADNLGDPEIVVTSSAITDKNPELAEAKRRGVPIWPRAKMLAHLAENRQTVAVAGTHGKTSTSAMVASMLHDMGEDPTFLIGGEVVAFGTNGGCGEGPHYVVEADESDGSFIYLNPAVALVTNIEAEHLDHYGTLEKVESTFVEFMAKVPEDGTLVLYADDTRLLELSADLTARKVTYGSCDSADVRYHSLRPDGLGTSFSISLPNGSSVDAFVPIPGEHMVANATGAVAVAVALGLDGAAAARGILAFAGVKRRFDKVGEVAGVSIVDDYAHHPTEIRATLGAARGVRPRRLWALFQPHRYSRTETLGPEFGDAFDMADRVVVMDVYSAGEVPIPGVSGKTVIDSVLEVSPRAQVTYLPHRADIAPYLADRVKSGDMVMTMGAGDVTTMGPEILRALAPQEEGAGCR